MQGYLNQNELQRRFDELQDEYSDVIGKTMPNGGAFPPRNVAYMREVRKLYEAGFQLPKDSLYVVAAFAGDAKNPLQEFGRRIYYYNPERFHALLPLLGKRMDIPNAPKPGKQPVRAAARREGTYQRAKPRPCDHS